MGYYNIDSEDGQELCAGLSEHEARAVAQRTANRLGQTAYLYEGGTAGEDEVEFEAF